MSSCTTAATCSASPATDEPADSDSGGGGIAWATAGILIREVCVGLAVLAERLLMAWAGGLD
jgi:hypothetical protein